MNLSGRRIAERFATGEYLSGLRIAQTAISPGKRPDDNVENIRAALEPSPT
jgi:hypothetical protein